MANISPRSKLTNVAKTVPPDFQDFVRMLLADNQELRDHILALETQVAALTRRR